MPSFRDCVSWSENRESFTPLVSEQTTLTFVINNSRLQFSTVGFVASLELTKIRRRRFLIDEVWINTSEESYFSFFSLCHLRFRLELYSFWWWMIVGRSHLLLESFYYWQSMVVLSHVTELRDEKKKKKKITLLLIGWNFFDFEWFFWNE